MSAPRVAATLLAAATVGIAGEAAAQQTVRELMDAGGRMASPAELRALLGLGPAPVGAASSAAPAGATGAAAAPAAAAGTRIDDAGRGCVDGDCRWYWRTADGRWLVSSSPDTAAPLSARPAR